MRAAVCDKSDGISDGNLLVSWGQEIVMLMSSPF